MKKPSIGRVTLVGAGPGDPELLTVKAIRAMQDADIILFDALVSEEVLAFARRETKRMLVGKRGHRPSCRQDEINAVMVKLARQGKHVVRLKGGDPGLFGRAGEEIDHLRNASIPVTIIPGITSASAMAASLGVSLTHRKHSRSVRFVTGHSQQGGLPEGLDWTGLAAKDTTIVIYMGGRTGAEFAKRLIGAGLSESTPCVIGASISRPNEERHFGTLGNLAAGALSIEADGPLLIGIGHAFDRTLASKAAPECDDSMMKYRADLHVFDHCASLATPERQRMASCAESLRGN